LARNGVVGLEKEHLLCEEVRDEDTPERLLSFCEAYIMIHLRETYIRGLNAYDDIREFLL